MEKHALLIGVSQYPASDLSPLPAAVGDIHALGKVLGHPEMGAFPEANIKLLENPGRQAMEEAIERLFSGRDKDDLLLLYFSGHGLKDDTGSLYLATRETRRRQNGELARATAVAAGTVREEMERSRSRHRIIILDSCYSGAFPAGLAIKDDGSIDIKSQLISGQFIAPGGEGEAILTASTSTRHAFGQDGEGLSLYTRFLIRGIETGEADTNGNGFVTASELHEYARERVQAAQPAMQPGIYLGGGGGAIRVAGVPIGDPRERYIKEVEKSLDHRGEIAIAARPRLNDWRTRLPLSTAAFAEIEAEVVAAYREEFRERSLEYYRLVEEIFEKRGSLEAEKAHLDDCRKRLGLTEEDARQNEAAAEKEVAAQRERHERNLQGYEAFFRTTIQREGASLADETRADLARLQATLSLSDKEVAGIEAKAIRESARREEKRPLKEPGHEKKKHWAADSLVTIIAGVFTIIASALAIWSFWGTEPDQGRQRTETVTPLPAPVVSQADAGAAGDGVGDDDEQKSRQDGGGPRIPSEMLSMEQVPPLGPPPSRRLLQAEASNTTPPPPEPAQLVVRSNVTGDTVTIDGRVVGPTGSKVHELAAGTYTVRVEKAGYEPFEERVMLAAGEKETVRARLARQVAPPVGWGERPLPQAEGANPNMDPRHGPVGVRSSPQPTRSGAPGYANWRALWRIQAHPGGLGGAICWPDCIRFSPDGRTLLTGSYDNTMKLWDVAGGPGNERPIRAFTGHSDWVRSVAFSPDGRAALSGSDDKTLKLWDVVSGREIRTFKGHSNSVWSVAFSPDGRTALSGSWDNTLKLWDVASGEEVRTFTGHSNRIQSVAFSPDGQTVLSGSDDNTLRLWNVASGQEIRTFQGHSDDVNSVAFAPDGRTALSGSDDKTLKLWDVVSGREIRTFKGHSNSVWSVAFSPDGRTALSGSDDKTLKLWDVASGQEIRTLPSAGKGHSSPVTSVAFSPDGRRAASGGWNGVLILWGEE